MKYALSCSSAPAALQPPHHGVASSAQPGKPPLAALLLLVLAACAITPTMSQPGTLQPGQLSPEALAELCNRGGAEQSGLVAFGAGLAELLLTPPATNFCPWLESSVVGAFQCSLLTTVQQQLALQPAVLRCVLSGSLPPPPLPQCLHT